jgi:hypothetical protein
MFLAMTSPAKNFPTKNYHKRKKFLVENFSAKNVLLRRIFRSSERSPRQEFSGEEFSDEESSSKEFTGNPMVSSRWIRCGLVGGWDMLQIGLECLRYSINRLQVTKECSRWALDVGIRLRCLRWIQISHFGNLWRDYEEIMLSFN